MPVLLVHGVPATSRLWRGMIERIERDDEVVAIDLPGVANDPPPGWVACEEATSRS